MQEKKTADKQPLADNCWNRIGVNSGKSERCPELTNVLHCRNCPKYSDAGRRLLDRPIPAGYQQEWASLLAKEKTIEPGDTKSAFVFRTGGEWLALPATLIQEVVDMGAIHSLPHRSSVILRGLVNVRGKLELCVSIGGILGIERETSLEDGYRAPERLVVLSRNGQNIVFPVTEVKGIVRYRPEMIRDLPVTVSGSKAAFTRGILCLNKLDIGLLLDDILFETLTRSLA